MKQSPLLEFESSAFTVIPGEDESTNPGIYGKALAEWLADQLRAAGLPADRTQTFAGFERSQPDGYRGE